MKRWGVVKEEEEFVAMRPLLGLSVWEHMWISEYGINGKRKYVEKWWEAVRWDQVAYRLSILAP